MSAHTAVFDNIIGGTGSGEGNIISGNGLTGVSIGGPDSIGNVVQGNSIGTDVSGAVAIGNAMHGIVIAAPGNTIGGASARAGNLFSGNHGNGIAVGGSHASGNLVQGNSIGTDISGESALPNGDCGVALGSCSQNTIGGSSAARNIIRDNNGTGITLHESDENVISYNWIQDNALDGISLTRSRGVVVARNVLSSNIQHGIRCSDRSSVTIMNNTIVGNLLGGLLSLGDSSFVLSNSILWNPEANYEVELGGGGGADAVISYTDVRGGWGSVYCDPESHPPSWGEGMIDADPRLWNPAEGDYHLSANSPCIDAGTDSGGDSDIDGDAVPQGNGYDVGADEYTENGPAGIHEGGFFPGSAVDAGMGSGGRRSECAGCGVGATDGGLWWPLLLLLTLLAKTRRMRVAGVG